MPYLKYPAGQRSRILENIGAVQIEPALAPGSTSQRIDSRPGSRYRKCLTLLAVEIVHDDALNTRPRSVWAATGTMWVLSSLQVALSSRDTTGSPVQPLAGVGAEERVEAFSLEQRSRRKVNAQQSIDARRAPLS